MNCTKVSPKPEGVVGQWAHMDAILTSSNPIKRYGDSGKYECPNCKGKFKMTLTEAGLYENAQVVAPVATEAVHEVSDVPVQEA
jgi:hypothetical protein